MDKGKTAVNILTGLAAAFGVMAVFAVGIYLLGWRGGAARQFSVVVPFPAAVVNSRLITYHDLFTLMRGHEQLVKFQGGPKSTGDTARSILDRLIENELADQAAREKGVWPDGIARDAHYADLLKTFGIPENEAAERIKEMLGMSERQFRRLDAEPDLLRTKLQESLGASKTVDELLAEKKADARIYIFLRE